ncbi:hypothetical protein C8R41DRAFT_922356 [Lentinula lateritia]|uniref:Uncharacterized protein n=1 Tax=Lentinula lateritia TaxID=40482 RepID=A0ABQ8VE77_9AGAR|nr:hypothetical protein C8R41DRAFT_922356 [Lentinula lateritia]
MHLRILSVCVAALGVVHAAPLNVTDRGPSFEAHNGPSTSITVVEFIGQYAGAKLQQPASKFESEKVQTAMDRVLNRQESLYGRMPHPREFKILNKFKEATGHWYDTKYFECMMQTLDLHPCDPPFLCIFQVPYKETDLVPSNLEMRVERLRNGTLLPPVDVLGTASGLAL